MREMEQTLLYKKSKIFRNKQVIEETEPRDQKTEKKH